VFQSPVGALAHHLLDLSRDLFLLAAHEGVDLVREGLWLDLSRFDLYRFLVGEDGVEVVGGLRSSSRLRALLGALLRPVEERLGVRNLQLTHYLHSKQYQKYSRLKPRSRLLSKT
jgi:hypothetical protein